MVAKAAKCIEREAQFADCGQLVPQLTLHEVLVQRGEAGATYALGHTERVRGRRATSDVLTGRRGRRIIRAAKEHLDDKARTAAEEARAFVYSAWCHASFPHKSPASVEETWTVQTDYVSLRVDPGMRTTDTGEYSVGLPDGAYARLSCIDWSSRPYNNCSRDIKLGKNLGDTMKRLGLNAGGGRTREEAAGASRAAGTFGGSFHCVRSDCLHLHIARRLKRLFGENPVAPTSPNSPSQNHPRQIPSRRRG